VAKTECISWSWEKAARGKFGRATTAAFSYRAKQHLFDLKSELLSGDYRPGPYRSFVITEPKRRVIRAAPFRDRVVHHALCNILEPRFEAHFSPHSFANRVGRGTHACIARVKFLAKKYQFALRLDIQQHFASIDHGLLQEILVHYVPDPPILALINRILDSGAEQTAGVSGHVVFPGDDLLAALRPKGLPIGNLTSQLWSNLYLHGFDEFVQRELRCKGYARYVDDMILFANDKKTLWRWREKAIARLGRLRLRIHEAPAQPIPCAAGIPWLGFVIYPTHMKLKARQVREATRRLRSRLVDYENGALGFEEFDASVQGWINHASIADTWGIRQHVLSSLRYRIRARDSAEK
jgi:RNA-directed DNA polymerase